MRLSLSGDALAKARTRLHAAPSSPGQQVILAPKPTPRVIKKAAPDSGKTAEPGSRRHPSSSLKRLDNKGPKKNAVPEAENAGPPDTKRSRQIASTLELLCVRFPETFMMKGKAPRPLKRGIDEDIRAELGDEVGSSRLAATLRFYTSRRAYLSSVARGGKRIGIGGTPDGVVTAEEMDLARKALAGKK